MNGGRYRVLQIRATYMHKNPKGVKLDVIVDDLDGFKKQMKILTGARDIRLAFEVVDDNMYAETEEIIV